MTKSQSAARFLTAAGPNLMRRGSTELNSSSVEFADKFTGLDQVPGNGEITPLEEIDSNSTNKSIWSPKTANRYEVGQIPPNAGGKAKEWSCNFKKI